MCIDIADRPAKIEQVGLVEHLFGERGIAFEFDAPDRSGTSIRRHTGKRVVDAIIVRIDTDRTGNLDILVVGIEGRDAVIEVAAILAALVADFVAVDFFRVELHEIIDFGIRDRAAEVEVRCCRCLAARIEGTTLEALRVGCIEVAVVGDLIAHGNARAEIIERGIAIEIGRRGKQGRGATEEFGEAADIGAAQDFRGALVFGVACSDSDAEAVGQIEGEVAEYRPCLGADIAKGLGVEAWQGQQVAGCAEKDVEDGRGVGIQIVDADNAVEAVARIQDLEFFRELVVGIDGRHVEVGFGQAVKVDRRCALVFAIGEDVLQRNRVGQGVLANNRTAIGFRFLLDDIQAGPRVILVAEDRVSEGRELVGDQAVALAGVGIVLGIVSGDANLEVRIDVPFG